MLNNTEARIENLSKRKMKNREYWKRRKDFQKMKKAKMVKEAEMTDCLISSVAENKLKYVKTCDGKNCRFNHLSKVSKPKSKCKFGSTCRSLLDSRKICAFSHESKQILIGNYLFKICA